MKNVRQNKLGTPRIQHFPTSTHSYSCRIPSLGLKLRFELFFPIKVDPNLESQYQVKNIPVVLPSSSIIFLNHLRQIDQGVH